MQGKCSKRFPHACFSTRGYPCSGDGFGLIEFMVTLAIFTLSANALMLAHLTTKRMHDKALQHTMAVTLAADLFQRIGANADAAASYQMVYADGVLSALQQPETDCSAVQCTPQELAAYDLSQWYATLLGYHERKGEDPTARFRVDYACVQAIGGIVSIRFTWRERLQGPPEESPGCADTTGSVSAVPDEPSVAVLGGYRQLTVSSYLGASG